MDKNQPKMMSVRRAQGWNKALESSRTNSVNISALIRPRVAIEPLAPKLYNWLQFKSVIIAAAFNSTVWPPHHGKDLSNNAINSELMLSV